MVLMLLVLVLMMLVLVMKLAMLLMTPAGSDAVVDDGVDNGDSVIMFCPASLARLNNFDGVDEAGAGVEDAVAGDEAGYVADDACWL